MRILCLLLSLGLGIPAGAAEQKLPYRHFIRNKNGRLVEVITPEQLKLQKEQEAKEKALPGNGQEVLTQVKIEEGLVSAWAFPCRKWVVLGNQKDEAQDPKNLQKLKSLKKGQLVRFKIENAKTCEVKEWIIN